MKFRDLTGEKFGRWKVLRFNRRKTIGKYHYQIWDCICVCGNKGIIEGSCLKRGNSSSCGCYQKERIRRGDRHYLWKTEGLGYFGIHKWLRKYFGYATKCENFNCLGKSITFQWALMRGKKHERKRENYIQLCRSCHNSYDMTDEIKKKISNAYYKKIKI